MPDTVVERQGTYRGQPYEIRVSVFHADDHRIYQRDERVVKIRTKNPLVKTSPSADVTVRVEDSEPIESYTETFLWWTVDEHEPRSTDEHIEDVLESFKETVDERLETYSEVILNE